MHRMHQLDHRLEEAGFWLLVGTLSVAGLYVAFALALKKFNLPVTGEEHEFVKHLVVAFTAGLSALATATYGIRVIGDFEGGARRSERTRAVLDRLIKTMESEPLDLVPLRAQAMLGDVASWRLGRESHTRDPGLSFCGGSLPEMFIPAAQPQAQATPHPGQSGRHRARSGNDRAPARGPYR